MTTLGLREEERLVNNMHRAVDLMNEGAHPNDAIEKIARENDYGVELIARMVEGVNKSLSVATLKHASEEDRAKSFPLADVDKIVNDIFAEHVQTKVASACDVPTKDFSELGIMTERDMTKAASGAKEDGPAMTQAYIRDARRKLERFDAFFDKADELLSQKVAAARETVMRRVEDTIERLRPLSAPSLRKVAQNVTNYYPNTSEPLFELLRTMGRIDVPALDKTAGRCIFPQEQPYRAISDLHGAARELESLKVEMARMKEAAGLGPTVLTSALGGAASNALGLRREGRDGAEEPAQSDIDPEIVNVLKEMEARRNLMQLVLYDKDMKQYPFSKLVSAYNDAAGTVTDSYRHPNVLKNLMLQTLEGGDVKDVATMGQEAALGKTLAEQRGKDDMIPLATDAKIRS